MERTELPAGWRWTTISEVAAVNKRNPTLKSLPDNLAVTFLPMAGVNAELGTVANPETKSLGAVRKGFTPFAPGDVLFAKITPSMENGKAAIAGSLVNEVGFGSTEFHVITPGPLVTAKWIFHFIRQESFRADAKANFSGTAGQLRVPSDFVASYCIPLPPLADQQAIVAAIETQFTRLDAAVAALKRVQANLRRYRAAVLKAACTGQLVPTEAALAGAQGRAYEGAAALLSRILAERRARWEADHPGKKYKEPAGPDTSALPELPDGWCWATLEILASVSANSISSGPFGSALGTKDYRDSGIPIIRGQNIQQGRFVSSNFVYIDQQKAAALKRSSARAGDLVCVAVGTSGNSAIVPDPITNAVLSQNVNKISLDGKLVRPGYVLHAMETEIVRQQMRDRTTDVVRSFLSLTNLKRTAIPLPPLAEQTRIVAEVERHLSICDELHRVVEGKLRHAARLRQSILQRAFSGVPVK